MPVAAPFELHAEAVPGDPRALRWVVPAGLLPVGRVIGAPGRLGTMLAPGGLVVRALSERGALWTWLAGDDWAEHGPSVRDAITDAATDLGAWRIEESGDEVLALVASDVIERSLGAYIDSHGGRITLVSAVDGQVQVDLGGACARCPAVELTLHGRIERAIRERLGGQVVVFARDQDAGQGWLPRLLRR